MSTDTSGGLLGLYERFLWGMMDALGVSKSIERKILTATMLQFGAILAIFVLGVGLIGVEAFVSMFTPLEMAAFGGVFVLAIVALLNTILILQRDFIAPIKEVQIVAKSVANGELDQSVPETDQRDEIGSLVGSVSEMHEYLLTVSAQAAALSREQFDAPILEQSVPGSFGDALDRMETTLQDRIEDLERQRAEIESQNRRLTETAEDYTRTISRVAEGDLTERLDESVDHEVMVAVADAFNDMVAEWESMMSELRSFAQEVTSESDHLRTNAAEVRNASEDISGSVQEISDGVDRESRRLETASSEAENLSATIQEITASADTVATLTDETAEFGSDGRAAAEDAQRAMVALREQSDEVTSAVEELDETIGEIGDITDVILDIADQTNILALNAGIEAARAEAGGEGFAVVAEEVKSLAQETKESAEEIGTLIAGVQEASSNTVDEIEDMREQVESGSETVETTTDAFARMAENVSEINTSIQEVNDATAEQAESMQDVVAMIEDIATISDQTAAEAETVAAAAEEQAATLNQVAENTGDLADDAGDLEASLRRFEVNGGRENAENSEGSGTGPATSRPSDRRAKSTSEHGNGTSTDTPAGERDNDSNVARADTSEMEWESLVTDGGDTDT